MKEAPRPAAYLIPSGWPAIQERLLAHGIPFTRLKTGRRLTVETYRAASSKFAEKS